MLSAVSRCRPSSTAMLLARVEDRAAGSAARSRMVITDELMERTHDAKDELEILFCRYRYADR